MNYLFYHQRILNKIPKKQLNLISNFGRSGDIVTVIGLYFTWKLYRAYAKTQEPIKKEKLRQGNL
jgi:hypothetical protein